MEFEKKEFSLTGSYRMIAHACVSSEHLENLSDVHLFLF